MLRPLEEVSIVALDAHGQGVAANGAIVPLALPGERTLVKPEGKRAELHVVCTLAINYFRLLATYLDITPAEKQQLLEVFDPEARLAREASSRCAATTPARISLAASSPTASCRAVST